MNPKRHGHATEHTLLEGLTRVAARKAAWVSTPPAEKLRLLDGMLGRLQQMDHDGWGAGSAAHQGYDLATRAGEAMAALEGMVNAAVLASTIRTLRRTYATLVKTGDLPVLPTERRHGRTIVPVFPRDLSDRLGMEGMGGVTGEVWLSGAPDEPICALPAHQGCLTVVLGAGNQTFLAVADVLHQMFVEGAVCVLKHHPLRDFSCPFVDTLCSELIDEGFFFACTGDVEVAQTLLSHPAVDHVHMTGGTKTHDAIVWGSTAEEQVRRKAANTPVLRASMTSELGCVTPWFITPGGRWTDAELDHVAGHLVAAFTAQNSCNCLSPQVLVLDEDWPQHTELLDRFRTILAAQPLAPPHYPGVRGRYASMASAYPEENLERIGTASHPGVDESVHGVALPWLLIHLDPSLSTRAIEEEAFGPVLAIQYLKTGSDPVAFLDEAVAWANQSVWGTLSCTLVVHPEVATDCEIGVERAIADLHYGCIGVNIWTSLGYGLPGATWGAYPGESLDNVASGIGVVRNAYLLRGVEKTVVRAPIKSLVQIVSPQDGKLPLSARQARALRDVVLRPSVGSFCKMGYHLVFSPPS